MGWRCLIALSFLLLHVFLFPSRAIGTGVLAMLLPVYPLPVLYLLFTLSIVLVMRRKLSEDP